MSIPRSAPEPTGYEAQIQRAFGLARTTRLAARFLLWLAFTLGFFGLLNALLFMARLNDQGNSSFFGSNSGSDSPSFQDYLQTFITYTTGSLGWAALVGVLALGLQIYAARLELDVVNYYSAAEEVEPS